MRNSPVDKVVHSICKRGCCYVNALLDDIDARQGCEEFLKLDQQDQLLVIEELRSVMSVYDQTGSCKI